MTEGADALDVRPGGSVGNMDAVGDVSLVVDIWLSTTD
jgi:hypothetical protein